jgi:transposase
MGRRGYPPEFRSRVLDLIEAGRRVAEVADDLGISDQTIYTWRRQDRIDRGLEAGLTSAEKAELVAARKRIRALVDAVRIGDSARIGDAVLGEQIDRSGAPPSGWASFGDRTSQQQASAP